MLRFILSGFLYSNGSRFSTFFTSTYKIKLSSFSKVSVLFPSSFKRYELMTECWRENPATRPSFSELISRVEAIMTRDVSYCDLSKRDESSPYYNVPVEPVEDSGEES